VPLARRRHRCAALALAGGLLLAACGGGSDGDQRADQVRSAASGAGLPRAVVDVLALAAKGPEATYRLTYAGKGGASIVVSQRHGDRRVDELSGDTVVSSRVLRHGVGYTCAIDTTQPASAKKGLTCERVAGDLTQGGQFTPTALATFSRALAASRAQLRLSVTHRTIAHTPATCLESRPKDGSSGVGSSTLCVSHEGAQLLVDANGQQLKAVSYTTDVPARTFDVAPGGDR
jgi:hypothetical protein